MNKCSGSMIVLSALFIIFWAVLGPSQTYAQEFSGFGGSLFFGTGSPNEIDAVTELADDLNLDDGTGNIVLGAQGFYQADRYRLGATFQIHAWAGANKDDDDTDDDAVGAGAFVYGFYGAYTIRHDRFLFNVGGNVGTGKAFIGYNLENVDPGDHDDIDDVESVSTFYFEPFVSFGIATCRYFGVEFQLSSPLFLFTDDLELTYLDRTYKVKGSDMSGIIFSVKLTFGKIANP